jgi:hypothetical protein
LVLRTILWVTYVIFELIGVYYKRQMTNDKILMSNEAQNQNDKQELKNDVYSFCFLEI